MVEDAVLVVVDEVEAVVNETVMLTVENVRKVATTPSQSLVLAIVVPPPSVPVAVGKPSKYAFE